MCPLTQGTALTISQRSNLVSKRQDVYKILKRLVSLFWCSPDTLTYRKRYTGGTEGSNRHVIVYALVTDTSVFFFAQCLFCQKRFRQVQLYKRSLTTQKRISLSLCPNEKESCLSCNSLIPLSSLYFHYPPVSSK